MNSEKPSVKTTLTVQTTVNASPQKVWEYWNAPKHIARWAVESDDWQITHAENDLRAGGRFTIRTESKDKSQRVDFVGTYTLVNDLDQIVYDLEDGRHVRVDFEAAADGVRVTETFEPKETSSEDDHKSWRATLENFRFYVERT